MHKKAAQRVVTYSELSLNVLQLPRLPIPNLIDTAARYEASVRAVKKQSTIDNHLAVFRKFLETDGPAMQQVLVKRDQDDARTGTYPYSYVEPLWDDGYLKYRGPSPINIAPALTLKPLGDRIRELVDPADLGSGDPSDAKPDVQSYAAAYMVRSMLSFAQKMLVDGVDVPAGDVAPLDVSGLKRQFGFTRMPKDSRDSVLYTPLEESMGHIAVLHRGAIQIVPTRDPQTKEFFGVKQLAQALRNIVVSTPTQPEYCVGALSGGSRDDWATARKLLIDSSAEHATNFNLIDSAFTVVCLDANTWGTDASKILPGMLTGNYVGESTNSKTHVSDDLVNRWYDKHQIIVDASPEGRVAGCFEHCFSDGIVWARWIGEVYHDLAGTRGGSGFTPLPSLRTAPASAAPSVIKLKWDIPPGTQLATTTTNAVDVLHRLSSSVGHAVADLPIGKDTMKTFGVSPDAFCQMVFHLAYMRTEGRLAPAYESCSTGRFFHGRTETIRSATVPMYELCSAHELLRANRAAGASTERKEELRALAKSVAMQHVELAKLAAQGQGIDRHLLALREVCRGERSDTGLAFFNEHVYEFSGTWLLSTSNISMPYFDLFNFGPVAESGYGIGYNIQQNQVRASVSAFEPRMGRAEPMAEAIVGAANDLASVFQV